MTERHRLIPISDEPGEHLPTERRMDIGQMSPLPVGETSELAFERRVVCKVGIEHSPGIPADHRSYSSPERAE
jgi:hypothetical protein